MWWRVHPKRIFLAPGAINIRLGIDSLFKLANEGLETGLSSGDMVVFCNKAKNSVKLLHFNGDYDLFHYRLDKGHLAWPETGEFRSITKDELKRFLETGAIITACL